MMFKREAVEGRLQAAVREWEGSGAEPSAPAPPDGSNFKEIKQAWKYTEDTRNLDFDERLPSSDRASILNAQNARASEVTAFDGTAPSIEGIYLESCVDSF